MKKIAIPLLGGRFSSHFGGAEGFTVFTVDTEQDAVLRREDHPAPEHAMGSFPAWLASRGVNVVIAAGMGPRAVQMLQASGIEVVLGAAGDDPRAMVEAWMAGELTATGESCHDHGRHHGPGAAPHHGPGGGHGHGPGGGHGHGPGGGHGHGFGRNGGGW